MWAAASAWEGLGAELTAAGTAYRSVVSGLGREAWRGPASASMTTAASRYAAWLTTTGEQVKVSGVGRLVRWKVPTWPGVVTLTVLRLVVLSDAVIAAPPKGPAAVVTVPVIEPSPFCNMIDRLLRI